MIGYTIGHRAPASPPPDPEFEYIDEPAHAARAFARLSAGGNDLANCARFEARLLRAIQAAEARLTALPENCRTNLSPPDARTHEMNMK